MPNECIVIETVGTKRFKCRPLKIHRKEQVIVDRKLNATCRRLYWFFKRISLDGERKVSIKDCDLIKIIDCAQRTLFVSLRILNHHDILEINLTSHKGKSRASPRKVYIFKGIKDERMG